MTGDDSETEADRPRAVLTREDRKFLTGQKAYEGENADQQERNVRYRIRGRIGDAIRDFSFLHSELPENDLDTIFEKLLEENRESLVRAVAFIMRGVDDVASIEEFLQDVLYEAATEKHPDELVTIKFTFDRQKEKKDPQKALDRLLTNRGTFRDLEYLIEEGETKPLITELAQRDDPIKIKEHYGSDVEGKEYTLDELIKERH